MVSLAFVFGPTPTPRAYVAATPPTTQTLAPYITGGGFTYFTPEQAGDEFDVMSSLNVYHVVIVADYPPDLQAAGFLSNSRIIVMSDYANSTLQKNLQAYFGTEVTVVSNPQQLEFDLSLLSSGYTSNNVGLPVSQGLYSQVTLVEGLLSLTIPFFALAFFARYMIESESKGIVRLAQGAAFSFFVFLFGELIFIQTDILLTLPVALHATISCQETAIGVLGFGGGSRPRMVMGALGFLFGAFAGSLKGKRLDRPILIGLLSVILFLVGRPAPVGPGLLQCAPPSHKQPGGDSLWTGCIHPASVFPIRLHERLWQRGRSDLLFAARRSAVLRRGRPLRPLYIRQEVHRHAAPVLLDGGGCGRLRQDRRPGPAQGDRIDNSRLRNSRPVRSRFPG